MNWFFQKQGLHLLMNDQSHLWLLVLTFENENEKCVLCLQYLKNGTFMKLCYNKGDEINVSSSLIETLRLVFVCTIMDLYL